MNVYLICIVSSVYELKEMERSEGITHHSPTEADVALINKKNWRQIRPLSEPPPFTK